MWDEDVRATAGSRQGSGAVRRCLWSSIGLALLILTLLPLASVTEAATGRRLALVTGNGDYRHVATLPNPIKDARAIGGILEAMGFEVETLLDLDTASMERAVRRFAERSRDAEIAMFYYAGHGVQVDGRNYLLPVDANITRPRDLAYEAITLDLVTEELENSGAQLTMVLLDACRDNPLEELFKRQAGTLSRSVDTANGLAQTQGAAGMLIAYATAPDTVALDGRGNHSPFSQALLEWLDQPGIEVGRLFRRVRERVIDITGGQQVPWVEEAVIGEYYLNGRTSETTSAPNAERLFWEHVQTIDDANERLTALQRYMLVFPDGERTEDARRMRRILMQNLAAAGIEPAAGPANPGLTLRPVETEQTAALDPEAGETLSAARTGDPATLCVRAADDPLAGAGMSGRWLEDRRYPLAPSLLGIDAEQAIAHCRRAVEQTPGNPALETLLARGLMADGRFAEALRHLRPSADGGHPVAQYALATMFRDGQRVPPDAERARALFEKAADGGHLGAAFELGLAFRDGSGVPADGREAIVWFTKAAEGGYDWAQYELGRLLASDAAEVPDPAAALDWWRRAAEQGNARAAADAGLALKRGEGVPLDPTEASRWLRLAVLQGEERAELPLAELLLLAGDGVEDEAEAAKLLEQAARRRDGRAALLLGEIHAKGASTVADPALAAYWLAAAHAVEREAGGQASATFAALPRSAVVEALQRALADAGYDPGAIDGAMGRQTRTAIEAFRQANGLAADVTADLSIDFLARLIASGSG